jgi:divalent metal cation (Fe/Co/Zn/Cd) transporter
VPGVTTVRAAHDLGVKVEEALESALPGVEVTIHIEPIEDQKSWEDHALRGIEPPP